jgi:hypothetical protein
MKPLSWLALLCILALNLAGCASGRPTIQPTQVIHIPSPTISSANVMTISTSTLAPTITDTKTPVPTETVRLSTATLSPTLNPTPLESMSPEKARETIQPLLKEPMNCEVPCFWGIIPGKTPLNGAKTFFSSLCFTPKEGEDFYSIAYKPDNGVGFSVIFYTSGNIIENIKLTPDIAKPTEGSPREWIAYSPETLIERFGSPSRVEFAIDNGPNYVIVMTMYFEPSQLIALYSGYNMLPERPHSPKLCPLTAPFDYVRLWIGQNPTDPPSFETVSLEDATSLSMDQFTLLILGDPQKACFTINGDMFP